MQRPDLIRRIAFLATLPGRVLTRFCHPPVVLLNTYNVLLLYHHNKLAMVMFCDVLINLLVSTWKAANGWETWLRASCSTALLQSVKFTPSPKFNINLISLPFLLARPPWTSTFLLAPTLSSISLQSSFSRTNKRDISSTLPATYFSSVLQLIQLHLSTMTGT